MDTTFDLSEFMGVFIDEVEEQLQIMDQEVLELEQNGDSEEVVQKLFRAAHTIKGSSATMGFEDMTKLTHEMEHLLDHVRNKRLAVTSRLIDLLFKCLDELRQLKDEIIDGEEVRTDITGIIQEVQSFSIEENDDPKKQTKKLAAVQIPKEAEQDAKLHAENGSSVFHINILLSADCEMKSVRAFLINNQLQSEGSIIYSSPSDGADESEYVNLSFLLATENDSEKIKEFLSSMTDVEAVDVVPFTIEEERKSNKEQPSKKKPGRQEDTRQTISQTIRVDVNRLEHIMNLVGELVIDQTRISRVSSRLKNRYKGDADANELEHVADRFGRVIGELQESVMKVRMLPISQLFSRYPRMVRDLSHSLNKEIDLVIEGQETELDRTVIEKIGDPLIHLIRNAVDHGLETPDERIKKNKPAQGKLNITASHEENQVVIMVKDDGAGIDPDKMRSSAVTKGLITKDEADKLTDQEAIHLIFRPGFSTVSKVSDVSGRGVGMDIVRNHIESLNGMIELSSVLGEGTTFKIKLPLTLAIITGLLIKLQSRTFIIPMTNVLEIVRVAPDTIQTIKDRSIVVIRDEVLPAVWLHDALQIPRKTVVNPLVPVVIVGVGEKRIALVVDELLGNQEIVVKSLGKYVGQIDAVSGATILGDGRAELILEIAGINRMMEDGRIKEVRSESL